MAKPKTGRAAAVQVQTRRAVPEWLFAAVPAALAFAVYANSLTNGFVGDDQYQLLRNPAVSQISAIPRLFAAGVWSFWGATANYYRPLPFVVYNLVYHLAGFKPWAFHLLMILLHVANTILLFALLKSMARRMASARIAAVAAVLFALHPVHTEAVDWIASLPDVLVTMLALAGLLLFARQDGLPRAVQIAVHCAIYLLALWTKETGVALVALYFCFGFSCCNGAGANCESMPSSTRRWAARSPHTSQCASPFSAPSRRARPISFILRRASSSSVLWLPPLNTCGLLVLPWA